YWLGTQKGIYAFTPATGALTLVAAPGFKSGRLTPQLAEDAEGFIWASSQEGFFRINPRTRIGQPLLAVPVSELPKSDQKSLGLACLPDGRLLLASRRGLWTWEHNRFDRFDVPGVDAQTEFRDLMVDREGLLWAGTGTRGLFVIDPQRRTVLHHFNYAPDQPLGLGNNTIYNLYQDQRQNIWAGTFNGLYRVQWSRREGQFWQNFPGQGNLKNHILALHKDRKGQVWTATMRGLFVANPRTGIQALAHPKILPGAFNPVSDFAEDEEGNMWFAINGVGLFQVPRSSYRVELIAPSSAFGVRTLRSLQFDATNPQYLWMNTRLGLVRFNCLNQEIKWSINAPDQSPGFFEFIKKEEGEAWLLAKDKVYVLGKDLQIIDSLVAPISVAENTIKQIRGIL
ncbi:MAG: two-component regulator propeller domain-containing protein, partial [Bacteroidota bacterium]